MTKTALITTEKKHVKPILIIDKLGNLGKALANNLKSEFLVVFVSKAEVSSENIVHVPFLKKIPSIPDNTYSHILLIGEKGMPKEMVKVCAKKALKDGSAFSLIIKLDNQELRLIEHATKTYEKTKTIIVDDIFSDNFIFDKSSEIGKLILHAKNFSELQIPNDGAKEEFPVFLEDAIDAILEAIFAEDKNKLFYVFPQNKTTLLSIALMLKKQNPNIHLDFVKEKNIKVEKPSFPQGGKYMISEPYGFEEKIKKISLENVSTETNELANKKRKNRKFSFIPIFVFLISLLILPFLSTIFFLFLGSGVSFVTNNSYFSTKSFELADVSNSVLRKELSLIGLKDKTTFLQKSISQEREEAQASALLKSFFNKTMDILFEDAKNPDKEFKNAILELNKAYVLQQEKIQAGKVDPRGNQEFKNFLNITSATVEFWPDILGFKGQRSYLVLLQDNLELRPGGGLINYYGVLKLDKGKITSFQVYDTNSDNTSKDVHIEPPFPIRRYIPSLNWHLKDSNFNVDFSSGAVASSIFINSQNNQQIDGVLGIDLYAVKSLLNLTKEISVGNQKVGAGNFFAKVFENKESEFLKDFYEALGEKLVKNKDSLYPLIVKSLSDSIFEKHLIFAFNDRSEEAAFVVNGWASSLLDERIKERSLNDFVGISEANLGQNKVNHFIERNLKHSILIDETGEISENLALTIKNNSQNNEQNLIYKNYLRFILPLGALVTGIKIDDKDQKIIPSVTDPSIYENEKFKQPIGLEVEKYNQANHAVYGLLVSVNPKETKNIQIEYILSEKINTQKDTSYSLRVFKQPGIDVLPFQFSINIPQNAEIVKFPEGFEISKSSGGTSLKINKDTDINLNLSFR